MHRIGGAFRVSFGPFFGEFLAHTNSMNLRILQKNGLKRLSEIHPPSMHYTLLHLIARNRARHRNIVLKDFLFCILDKDSLKFYIVCWI